MRGILPEEVRLRPKAPLAGDPISELLKRRPAGWQSQYDFAPALAEYVELQELKRKVDISNVWSNWINLRPIALSDWLKN